MSEDLLEVFASYDKFDDDLVSLLLTPVPSAVLSPDDLKALKALIESLQDYVKTQLEQ